MKRPEILEQGNDTVSADAHRYTFSAARDSRNRKVPGLSVRNGRYYACLWVEGPGGKKTARRFPLEASNITEAKEQLEIKRNDRREDKLPTSGRKPMLADYIETYLESATRQKRRQNTRDKDRAALLRWLAHIGNVTVNRITTKHIASYQDKRLGDDVTARTVNLDLISLRGLLKRALKDEHIRALPKLDDLDVEPRQKRRLLTPDEFQRLLTTAMKELPKSGQQFTDYLRFLAFSGCREQEALCLKWADVDFAARKITIGRNAPTKNGMERTLEFNPKLEGVLREMSTRRPPDSEWLFPSPQRGQQDRRTLTFRNALRAVRVRAGLEWFAFHDLRHYFASVCVMHGLDYMTIAEWLGHKDGGILVGKIYGHLLDAHRRSAADRLQFGIASVPAVAAV